MEWLKKFDSIEKLTQGSIIDNVDWGYTKDCNPLSIVLSNACDLEHEGHCSYLIVAAMHLAADVIQASREYKGLLGDTPSDKITKKQRKGIERLYSDYIHNRTINRYFFIDCSEIEPNLYMVVDFQVVENRMGSVPVVPVGIFWAMSTNTVPRYHALTNAWF